MISKMDERRKWKNINTEEGRKNNRRLRNELKRPQIIPKRNILRTHVTRLWDCKEQGLWFAVHEDRRTRLEGDPTYSKY